MANIQDNTSTDGFIGLAYVSQDQGEKESRIQTFDSISWASRAVIDGFTDETITQKSQLSDGDFESGANPEAAGSNWLNVGPGGSADTKEVVASWEGKTNVLHLKEASSTWAGVRTTNVAIDSSVTYDVEMLVWVEDKGSGTNAGDYVSLFWDNGSGSNAIVDTELVEKQWIKVGATGLSTQSAANMHLNIQVRNGAEIYVDYARARLTNRLILKDNRGIGNGISPTGSGLNTTYSYFSTSYKTHPIGADAGDGTGTYINKAVLVADFVREGLSDVVIKTNFHDDKAPGGANTDYTWYDSANGIDRLGQEITTSGTSNPWLSASGQYMQVQIDVITDGAGNGATINSFGCYTDPALYEDS